MTGLPEGLQVKWRRGWDLNPCGAKHHRLSSDPQLSHFETGTLPLCHPGNQNGRVCLYLKALLPIKHAEHIQQKESVS
jgi:hypothetical protein